MRHLSTMIFICALLLLPLSIWAEQANYRAWHSRLFLPSFKLEPNLHTPRFTTGTFLPPVINKDLILTPDHNPVLLTGTTRIPSHITVTITPGTSVFANEYALLVIEGKLFAAGTPNTPVTFTTNEVHPLNQTWGGIMITADGLTEISQAKFRHAAVSISCLPKSHVAITDSLLEVGSIDAFVASRNCRLTNNTIRGMHYVRPL